MHERTCDQNPQTFIPEIPTVVQVGRGGKHEKFYLTQSAFQGAIKVWRYDFSDGEQEDLYASLNAVVMDTSRELVTGSSGTFKWYLALKAIFHKASNPEVQSNPPPVFQTTPVVSFHKYDDAVWDIAKEQIYKKIENFETDGSGWILSKLVLLDVTINEMENPLRQTRGEPTSEDEAD